MIVYGNNKWKTLFRVKFYSFAIPGLSLMSMININYVIIREVNHTQYKPNQILLNKVRS